MELARSRNVSRQGIKEFQLVLWNSVCSTVWNFEEENTFGRVPMDRPERRNTYIGISLHSPRNNKFFAPNLPLLPHNFPLSFTNLHPIYIYIYLLPNTFPSFLAKWKPHQFWNNSREFSISSEFLEDKRPSWSSFSLLLSSGLSKFKKTVKNKKKPASS